MLHPIVDKYPHSGLFHYFVLLPSLLVDTPVLSICFEGYKHQPTHPEISKSTMSTIGMFTFCLTIYRSPSAPPSGGSLKTQPLRWTSRALHRVVHAEPAVNWRPLLAVTKTTQNWKTKLILTDGYAEQKQDGLCKPQKLGLISSAVRLKHLNGSQIAIVPPFREP